MPVPLIAWALGAAAAAFSAANCSGKKEGEGKSDAIPPAVKLPTQYGNSSSSPDASTVAASTYVCVANTHDQPWIQAYDIHNDGIFGLDDMKAYTRYPDDDPVDVCKVSLLGFLREEVAWKLKILLAGKIAQRETTAPEIDVLESESLMRLQSLSSNRPDRDAAVKNGSAIVELCLRAKALLKDVASEPFGIGVFMKPHPSSENGWPMLVTGVMPDSGAMRVGLRSGDSLVAVDGKPLSEWSSDGTVSGLYDPKTQLARGFNGPWGSVMRLQIRRSMGELVELQVIRNMWGARHLGTPTTLPLWDGKEMPKAR